MPRPPNAEKIAWIREDLGDDASLPDFSRKFLEIFGERVRETVPQKAACLKLYSVYARRAVPWVKESDLPPKELVAFERVWKPDAPNRCAECARVLLHQPLGEYCSSACRHGGETNTCRTCKKSLDLVHPYCTTCKRGSPGFAATTPGTDDLSKRIQAQKDMISMCQRLWFGGVIGKDPSHEPAWKRRRRS